LKLLIIAYKTPLHNSDVLVYYTSATGERSLAALIPVSVNQNLFATSN